MGSGPVFDEARFLPRPSMSAFAGPVISLGPGISNNICAFVADGSLPMQRSG
mgnify:FL=1